MAVDIEDVGSVSRQSLSTKRESQTVGISTASRWRARIERFIGDSFVPGTQTVYVKTWGCAHNNSDSEYMAGQLAAAGYAVCTNEAAAASAQLWLLNGCTAKTPAETQLRNAVAAAARRGTRVVLAGCVSQASPSDHWMRGVSMVGVQQIDQVVRVVEETLQGNCVRLIAPRRVNKRRVAGAPLHLPKIRKNPLVEILAINTGCLNRCTYCKTKQARGDLASYPMDELVERARQAFTEGVKEIWLTSEDLGAYGRDIGATLPDLLAQLVAVIPDDCMMRLGMTNPPYILDFLPEMAEMLNHPRVYSFLHMPVQSGSDAVLSDMKREYTCADFCRVVDYMREHVAGISIATDIICGFPTETSEDFDETLQLLRRYRFPSVYINQYFPRPNTRAAAMRRVDTAEVKRRTRAATALFRSYEPYAARLGERVTVLLTERAADGRRLVGHTKAYEQVLLDDDARLLGSWRRARVTATAKFCMHAELLDPPRRQRRLVVAASLLLPAAALCFALLRLLLSGYF